MYAKSCEQNKNDIIEKDQRKKDGEKQKERKREKERKKKIQHTFLCRLHFA
jgi:hypothetical protein